MQQIVPRNSVRKSSAPPRDTDVTSSSRKSRRHPAITPRSEPATNNDASGQVPTLRGREFSSLGMTSAATSSGVDFSGPSPGRTAGQAPNTGRLRHADANSSGSHFRYGAEFVGELEGFQMTSSTSHLLDGVVEQQRSRPSQGRTKPVLRSIATQSQHPLYDVAAPLPVRKPQTGSNSRTHISAIGSNSEQHVAIGEPDVMTSSQNMVEDTPMYTSQDIEQRVRKSNATLNLYEVSQRLQVVQSTASPVKSSANGKRLQQDAFQPLPSNKSAGKRRALQSQGRHQKVKVNN